MRAGRSEEGKGEMRRVREVRGGVGESEGRGLNREESLSAGWNRDAIMAQFYGILFLVYYKV